MTKNNEFFYLQELIFKERNYQKAIDIINSSNFAPQKEYQLLLGLAYFSLRQYIQSAQIYKNIGELYKAGYCHLLLGDNNTAQTIWKICSSSPAQNWGLFFCELFTQEQTTVPTYLQIRAFLERDLTAFLILNLVFYVQKIIDISELLFEVNPETNKIIARSFLYNNYPSYAKEYLNRALDFTEEDPEIYYLQALYFQNTGEIQDAKYSLETALNLNKNYIPAKLLLDRLNR